MKAGHLFPMMGILFLLSLLLVACQIGGGNTASSSPPRPVTSATPPAVTPGTTPVVPPRTTPVVPPRTTPAVPPKTTPGTDPNSPVAFASGIQTPATVSATSIVVVMPDDNTLSMNVTSQTDLSDFDGDLPEVGDLIKVDAIANADGSFMAVRLSHEKPDNPNINVITYQGVTTSAVGADDFIHFKVGLTSYSFTIPSSADLEDFKGNAQAIQANQAVIVKVEFNESEDTVLKVGKANQ